MGLQTRIFLLSLSLLSCAAATVESSCHWPVEWVTFDGNPRTLVCSTGTGSSWWQRNTSAHGGLTDCQSLVEDEWATLEDCTNRICNVRANTASSSLEYCCTGGANPAAVSGAERECFTLSVCPLVTSVAIVPSQLLAGHQASLYLTLISHPASFPPPLIKHTRAGHPTLLINSWNTTRSEFLNVNVTYSFTVPAEGRVDIFLSALRAPEGSDCGSTLSGDYSSEYMLPIADTEGTPPPPQCPCPTPQQTSSSQDFPSHTVPTSSSSHPPSPSSHPSPPLQPPSSHSIPTPTPSPGTTGTTDTCPQTNRRDVQRLTVIVVVLIVLLVAAVAVAVATILWACHIMVKARQNVSPSGKRKGSLNGCGVKQAVEVGFTAPHVVNCSTPSSLPPPLPTSSPPPLLPRHHHHQIISSAGSANSGMVVSAPPPPEETVVYSTPYQNGTNPRSSLHTEPTEPLDHLPPSSPTHSLSTASSVVNGQPSTEALFFRNLHCRTGANEGAEPTTYMFVGGKMFTMRDEVGYLDPAKNGPPTQV